jgi:hypothetical protein
MGMLSGPGKYFAVAINLDHLINLQPTPNHMPPGFRADEPALRVYFPEQPEEEKKVPGTHPLVAQVTLG